jgi:hypothetical protein
MNALKSGAYSQQLAQLGALFAADPKVRDALLAMARKHNLKRQRAHDIAAGLLTRFVQQAHQLSGGKLNLNVPVDDWDSTEQAASRVTAVRHERK